MRVEPIARPASDPLNFFSLSVSGIQCPTDVLLHWAQKARLDAPGAQSASY
eukprot:COSAG01_NODE_542_length_15693_cov_13.246253_20_plen_51_part_00